MPALDQREFDTWRHAHDAKIDRILDSIEEQERVNLRSEGRLSALEAHQKDSERRAGRQATYVSIAVGTVVSAAVAGVSRLLGLGGH
jgi:hypothetical protein